MKRKGKKTFDKTMKCIKTKIQKAQLKQMLLGWVGWENSTIFKQILIKRTSLNRSNNLASALGLYTR